MNAEDLKKLLAEATPGPWEAESGHVQQNGTLYWQVTDGADAIMQNQFCWTRGDAAANAALVALAPDLAARVITLEAALGRIAGQKHTSEMSDIEMDDASFEDGWNTCLEIARAALSEASQ